MKKFNINYLYIIGTIFVIAIFVSLFFITIVFPPPSLFETPLYMQDINNVSNQNGGEYIIQNEPEQNIETPTQNQYMSPDNIDNNIDNIPTLQSIPDIQSMPNIQSMPTLQSMPMQMNMQTPFVNQMMQMPSEILPTKVNPNLVIEPPTMMGMMNQSESQGIYENTNGPTGLTQGLIP
jgi:hypothetical protein